MHKKPICLTGSVSRTVVVPVLGIHGHLSTLEQLVETFDLLERAGLRNGLSDLLHVLGRRSARWTKG